MLLSSRSPGTIFLRLENTFLSISDWRSKEMYMATSYAIHKGQRVAPIRYKVLMTHVALGAPDSASPTGGGAAIEFSIAAMLRLPGSSPLGGASSEGCHGPSRRQEFGGRRSSLLSFLFASAALAQTTELGDSQKALLQKYLDKSKANKAKNDKERLDSYYKRNYKDYFDFVDGANRGKSDELLSDSDKSIRRWLESNK